MNDYLDYRIQQITRYEPTNALYSKLGIKENALQFEIPVGSGN